MILMIAQGLAATVAPPESGPIAFAVQRIVPQRTAMDRPRLYVDFNEMLADDRVLLSQTDTKVDSSGTSVRLEEGLRVYVYSDDEDEAGHPDPLIADGVAERHSGAGWSAAAPWYCRIDERGIRHASDAAREALEDAAQRSMRDHDGTLRKLSE